ncbi:MAG: carboxypeptidase-like regulatory domain-containing protein [Saprospiraceae bacterium]
MPITGIGTITNEYGFYSLTLPEDVDEIIVSYLGYQEEKNTLQLSKNLFITYQLSPSFLDPGKCRPPPTAL